MTELRTSQPITRTEDGEVSLLIGEAEARMSPKDARELAQRIVATASAADAFTKAMPRPRKSRAAAPAEPAR